MRGSGVPGRELRRAKAPLSLEFSLRPRNGNLGVVSSWVRAIGAASPARWQVWQWSARIRAILLVKVTGRGGGGSACA